MRLSFRKGRNARLFDAPYVVAIYALILEFPNRRVAPEGREEGMMRKPKH
jgi:hypothetical protein